jgi:hypothetical protein
MSYKSGGPTIAGFTGCALAHPKTATMNLKIKQHVSLSTFFTNSEQEYVMDSIFLKE